MAIYVEGQAYCDECEKYTLVRARGINHILHLLVTVLCCGWWVYVWGLMCVFWFPTWRCAKCGSVCHYSGGGGATKAIGYTCLAVGVCVIGFILFSLILTAVMPQNVDNDASQQKRNKFEPPRSTNEDIKSVVVVEPKEPVKPITERKRPIQDQPDERTKIEREKWLAKYDQVWIEFDKVRAIVNKSKWDKLDQFNQYIMCLTMVQIAHNTPRDTGATDYVFKVFDEQNDLLHTWPGENMAESKSQKPNSKLTPPKPAAPKPAAPKPVPELTANAKIVGSKARPIVAGKLVPMLDKYRELQTFDITERKKMISDGDIVIFDHEISIFVESKFRGYTYFRPIDGGYKNKLLVTQDSNIK